MILFACFKKRSMNWRQNTRVYLALKVDTREPYRLAARAGLWVRLSVPLFLASSSSGLDTMWQAA